MRLPNASFFGVAFLLAVVIPGALHAYEQEIDRLSAQMSQDILAAGKHTIAVVDYTDLQGNVTELGRFLAEEFSVALAGAGKDFEVVDRTHLRVLLQENKLSSKGLLDPSTVKKLGQIAGVEAIITGTLTPFGDTVRIAVKILDARTAKIVGSVRGSIAKTEAIIELLEAGISTAGDTVSDRKPKPSREVQSSQPALTREEFTFSFEKCVASGTTVICSLTVTNDGEDRKLYVYGNGSYGITRLYDNLGNEYAATQAKLGSSQGDGEVEKTMIRGIPIDVIFTFQGVSREASSVAVLEVAYWVTNSATIKYRDIPFSWK